MAVAVKMYKHFDTPKEPGVYHRLICLTGEDKGNAYFLMGKRIVMGRSENCDVTILDLKSSREHAEIILVGKNYILTDLGSQNGIVVNDLKIKQHALSNGDKIIVGKTVYKFSKVVVKEKSEDIAKKQKERNKKNIEIEDEEIEEEEPRNKRLTIFLGALILIAAVLLIDDDSGEEPKRVKNVPKRVLIENKEFQTAAAKRIKESKKNKEKLQRYFDRGLREFREGNYFRAISEFENAKQWSPNDPLANFYLRKTREALDEQIEGYFNKATRDIDAINYKKASTSYCAIVRLLNNYKKDSRYIAAVEGVKNLEKKMGLDEGDIECVDSSKGN